MTDLLNKAFDAARLLSPAERDDLARLLLSLLGGTENVHRLTDDERASIAQSRAQTRRGEFAADANIAAFWRRVTA